KRCATRCALPTITRRCTAPGAKGSLSRSRGRPGPIHTARSFMTAPSFVDASVLLYTQDQRDLVKHKRAQDWLHSLWRSARGVTSVQALSEFYVASTRKLGVAPQTTWAEVARYFAWDPQPVDEALL